MATTSLPSGLLVLATLAAALLGAAADNSWTAARATWFDPGPDISTANCHFKQSQIPTGYYVGAFSDYAPEFDGSCGDCYEIRCRPATFKDGYGNSVDRSSQYTCAFPGKSIVLTIADACPCKYPNNAYSNQRWCCNDMPHMDISEAAFKALADTNLGVIGIEWRKVDCSAKGSSGSSSSSNSGSNSGSNNGGSNNKGSNNGGSNNGGSTSQSNVYKTSTTVNNALPNMPSSSGGSSFSDLSSYFKNMGSNKQRRALRGDSFDRL